MVSFCHFDVLTSKNEGGGGGTPCGDGRRGNAPNRPTHPSSLPPPNGHPPSLPSPHCPPNIEGGGRAIFPPSQQVAKRAIPTLFEISKCPSSSSSCPKEFSWRRSISGGGRKKRGGLFIGLLFWGLFLLLSRPEAETGWREGEGPTDLYPLLKPGRFPPLSLILYTPPPLFTPPSPKESILFFRP